MNSRLFLPWVAVPASRSMYVCGILNVLYGCPKLVNSFEIGGTKTLGLSAWVLPYPCEVFICSGTFDSSYLAKGFG